MGKWFTFELRQTLLASLLFMILNNLITIPSGYTFDSLKRKLRTPLLKSFVTWRSILLWVTQVCWAWKGRVVLSVWIRQDNPYVQTLNKDLPCVDKEKGKHNSEVPSLLTTRWTTFSRLVNRIAAFSRTLNHLTLCFVCDTCALKTIVWLSVDPSLTVCVVSVFVITSWKEILVSSLTLPSDGLLKDKIQTWT